MTAAPFPFFVGRGRSGTTLVRSIFDSHPALAVPNESHFILAFSRRRQSYQLSGAESSGFDVERFADDVFSRSQFRSWGLDREPVIDHLRAAAPAGYEDAVRLLYALYAAGQGKPRYADKTPNYVHSIGALAAMFPEAKFVHIIRDGRDVALSYLDAGWGPNEVGEAAILWRRAVERGRRSGEEIGPGRYRELRYEDLVADTEGEVKRICEFIDLDFDPAMLNYFERADTILTGHGRPQAHRGLHEPPRTGMRDWRTQMDDSDVAVFERLAGPLLTDCGYERRHRTFSWRIRIEVARRSLAAWARIADRKVRPSSRRRAMGR